MNPKVIERFLDRAKRWNEEMRLLRKICLDCGLDENYKWMHPCYTYQGKNVVLIHEFKEYCALLFHKGVLLTDTEHLLVQQTENVQAARQIRFTNLEQIIALEASLKSYIFEAVEIEKSGVEVPLKKTEAFAISDEFQEKLFAMPQLKTAFEALSPGRQRGYLLYFSQPKQSKTRASRVEKYVDAILNGKGLND